MALAAQLRVNVRSIRVKILPSKTATIQQWTLTACVSLTSVTDRYM